MRVNRHAEVNLIAMSANLTVPASVILSRLRQMPTPTKSTAIIVAQLQSWRGDLNPDGDKNEWPSNGDTVVMLIRSGVHHRDLRVTTAMLRRSWNQPFTPEALGVEQVERWT